MRKNPIPKAKPNPANPPNQQTPPRVEFIHVGKCGGTTLQQLFWLPEYHLAKPVYKPNTKYVVWIRNPLHRYVSAFNMSVYLINLDTSKLDINHLTFENCLVPGRVRYKMTNNHTFSPEYDEMIKYFKTPNNLAESLTHSNSLVRAKAMKLMTHGMEHIFKGIGWYLDNGDFIEKHHADILICGKIETMEQDLQKLSQLLGKDISNKSHHFRKNESEKYDKHLSALAIKNLLNFYKDTDYKALASLHKYGMIDAATLASYSKY